MLIDPQKYELQLPRQLLIDNHRRRLEDLVLLHEGRQLEVGFG